MESNSKIHGTVKWFSKEKGYGFITDQENTDHFFAVREIIGAELPTAGAKVQFLAQQNAKGYAAKAVEIIEQGSSKTTVTCQFCQKQMVPRIVYHRSVPMHSLCPFCGKRHKNLLTFFRFIASLF